MFGFPIGNGNSGAPDFVEKFTNNADSGFPKLQQREVFYSIRSGNWNDSTVWQTVSGKVGILPTSIDDVYIRHSVVANTATTINNLFVSGVLSVTVGVGLTFNNIRCYGSLINNGGSFRIQGNQNYIEKSLYQFISGDIQYIGDNQPILDLNYGNLILTSSGTKYLIQDLFVNGTFTLSSPAIFEAYGYNITINGSTSITSTMNATGSGNYLFVGSVSFPVAGINFSGNPTMEFRNGMGFGVGGYTSNLGSGDINITTNNQSITSGTGGLFFNNAIKIASGITLTFPSNTTTTLNNIIDGLGATSKVVNSGNSNLAFGTQNAAENSMVTGIFDITTNANTVSYSGNYSATIPSRFPTFRNLTIAGTGIKTLGVNTTLNGDLNLNGQVGSTLYGNLECSIYNLTVTGITYFRSGGLYKSGSGNLLFIGNFQSVSGYTAQRISFTGNPDVEFRGGISQGNYVWSGGWNTGTGTWTFSTNNQTLQGSYSGLYPMPFTCKIIVSGTISLTFTNGEGATFADKIDGTVAGSTWINQGRMRFIGTEITPMVTGVFNYLTSTSSFLLYEYSGNQTIPYTSYQGFGVAGTGTKTLSGNTTVSQNFEFNDNVSHRLECSTYNFTVSGSSFVNGIIGKTGAGNLLFIGGLTWGGTSGVGNQGGFDLSGNPTLEFRGGITYGTYGMGAATNTGTGTITFSTNNQTVQLGRTSGANVTLNNNILISGAITVTLNNSTTNTLLAGSINGDNASSTLRIAANATTNYHSATQPMATGILDTSTNLNTWIYGLSNQNIKGGPTTLAKQVYRNLTLNGTGVKTLQGYVSVQNTYTLTAPATLALNGYTLTNP